MIEFNCKSQDEVNRTYQIESLSNKDLAYDI